MDLAGYADKINDIGRYNKPVHALHSSSFAEAMHGTEDGADLRQKHLGPHQYRHLESPEPSRREATLQSHIQQGSPDP
ncbi:hypothetical protein D3C80_1946860 [compost metagenome]